MATRAPAKKPLPKETRPTPGPGDANTPEQVAKVNEAQAAVDAQASSAPAAAPQAESASSPQATGGAPGAEDQTPGPEWATAEDYASHGPTNNIPDNKGGLTGPTDRPQEHITAGLMRPANGRPPIDPGTVAALARAAADPGAPPELKNLYAVILHEYSK